MKRSTSKPLKHLLRGWRIMPNAGIHACIAWSFLLAFLGILNEVRAQEKVDIPVIDGSKHLREICTLPKHINEASGLEITSSGALWTHNDGGNPMLFNIDTSGTVIRSLQLNVSNNGWEDLTIDEHGNLYVGAFGNNKNDKRNLKIFKISNPENISQKVINPETIKFSYEDQRDFPPPPEKMNFDVDAFIAFEDSVYLFTKNRTKPFNGYSKIYSLPTTPGDHVAQLVDSIYFGQGAMLEMWITSADISPDGKTLALLSHSHLWLISDFPPGKFSQGTIQRLELNHLTHKAGVAFSGDGKIYVVDELEFGILGGKLYEINYKEVLPKLH